METAVLPHTGKELTGKFMYHYAEGYPGDLGGLERLPFPVFYEKVKNLPYVSDEDLFPDSAGKIIEVVARPSYLLNKQIFPALDCKKKAILCGAWAYLNRVPFEFLAVSERPDKEIHHVVVLMDWDKQGPQIVDSTLPSYELGQEFPITRFERLSR